MQIWFCTQQSCEWVKNVFFFVQTTWVTTQLRVNHPHASPPVTLTGYKIWLRSTPFGMSQIALPGGRVPALRIITRDGAEHSPRIFYVEVWQWGPSPKQSWRATTAPPSSCLWFGFKSIDKNRCVNPHQKDSICSSMMSASWETLMFSFVWTCTEASPTHFVPELKVEAEGPASRQHVCYRFHFQAFKADSTTQSSSAIPLLSSVSTSEMDIRYFCGSLVSIKKLHWFWWLLFVCRGERLLCLLTGHGGRH